MKSMGKKLPGTGIRAGLLLLLLLAGFWKSETASAQSRDVALGTQQGISIALTTGDEGKFYLNTTDENSVYYSYREQIKDVVYYVEDWDDENVITAQKDGSYQVIGIGYTFLYVEIYDEDGELLTEDSYRINVSPDMNKVTLTKTNFVGYSYGQYSYDGQTFYAGLNGMAGANEEDVQFSYTSSNHSLTVYCHLENGKIVIEMYGVGVTQLQVAINGKVFKIKVTIKQVAVSGGTSLLLVPKQTKTMKVKGTSEKVTWKSSNSSVASITKTGKLKAKKQGNVIITAQMKNGKVGCVLSVVTKARKKVIATANKIGKHWVYSQPKRMQSGYYDCSSLVWKSYKAEKKYFGMKNYAPVAADVAKWCAQKKKMVKGNNLKNIQKMKFKPGALMFETGAKNGRYKGIYHVEMFVGYTFEGFDGKGNPQVGVKWAARPDNYYGGGDLWAQP